MRVLIIGSSFAALRVRLLHSLVLSLREQKHSLDHRNGGTGAVASLRRYWLHVVKMFHRLQTSGELTLTPVMTLLFAAGSCCRNSGHTASLPRLGSRLVAAGAVIAFAVSARAQLSGSAFDVASVKPHIQTSGFVPLTCTNGRLSTVGFPLIQLIAWAYDLNADQYRAVEDHLPKWMSPTAPSYDIEAKASSAPTETQCRLMTQALLVDRFKLASHWESREAQVFDLVVAKGGPKLTAATETDDGPEVRIALNGRPLTGARTGLPKGMTMKELADFLTSGMRMQPIFDRTGLEGRYKIELRFSIQPAGGDQVFEDPDLEVALQRQLGLRLEKGKGSVRLLVIDHIEQPSPN